MALEHENFERIREIRKTQECGLYEARRIEAGERLHRALLSIEEHDTQASRDTIVSVLQQLVVDVYGVQP